MYPERRPYATTMPHSGYRSKPIAPSPPADALEMLRSHVGYDDLRHGNREADGAPMMRTLAGRTYPCPAAKAPVPFSAATQHLLPSTDRSAQEALETAELQQTIQHEALTYHGCQQAALNAELRDKVEAHGVAWSARIAALQKTMGVLPAENAVHSNHEIESLQKYFAAYRCTEEMNASHGGSPLCTPMVEIDHMTQLPPVPSDAMRRVLDDMLRSPYLLAPLQNYIDKLSILDTLSAMEWSGEGPADGAVATRVVTTKPKEHTCATPADGADEAERAEDMALCPSRAAVALHERLHFNPGDYSERELKKSEEALQQLQQRVHTVKQKKEDAIDANDPIAALRSLHAQVDFSNDLLLLYKARMAQVNMHTEDVQDFRCDVLNLIDDARRAAKAVEAYAQRALPCIHYDVKVNAKAIEASDMALADAQATERSAESQMREQLGAMDSEAHALWKEVLELLEKIAEKAQKRNRYVQQCMSLREQRAKVTAQIEAQRKAQVEHCERLRQCEEVLLRWERIGSVYTKYVETCVPSLLKHLASVEDAHEDLAQREAEGYVAVFEEFVYAAEEARAKRQTQADRMRLLQRSMQLSQERIKETLDPDGKSHSQRLADATRELEEVQLYLKYVNDMEAERRSEVDPVLKRVLVRHVQSQATNESSPEDNALESKPVEGLLESGAAAAATEAPRTEPKDCPVKEHETPAPTTVAAAAASVPDNNGTPAAEDDGVVAIAPGGLSGPATMAHPFVAARQIGLAHEANYLHKQEQLTERELQEVEAKRTGLRHTREELRDMAAKYHNAEAIRSLLGLN
ncbi:hypothetical protein ABL78_2213 [Leptomonas seymouri]|uniref:Paraflagellar rod protein n=1 Tax=Leptomonas seymouri TaxID=5684 RepID=A0A0N1PCV3_LEPSE|nr:hypothetical protein ABL78_2213 [Leptomonas seymouri]|eukprot:KPI88675.1 hypothetical protein ABL78_2213 [Leptomonas seymouri]